MLVSKCLRSGCVASRLQQPVNCKVLFKRTRDGLGKRLTVPVCQISSGGKSGQKQSIFGGFFSSKGPITWKTLGVFTVIGGAAVFYVHTLRKQKQQEREREKTRSVGKAAIGGPFSLIDHNGERKTSDNFLGQWLMIYFGFCHCPDICPDELDKMGMAVDGVNKLSDLYRLQPIFISVDPERDTPEAIKEYLKDFHPTMIGLTGTREEVDKVAKAYRVYYSSSPVKGDNDYLVDHTIIMYLVGPDGNFIDYFGQNRTDGEITAVVANKMLKHKLSGR
ncbi:protein SCO1 homolog, mitochondrial-like [Corticium candelabrum]|uniref:protein SCO1 homolog, mitochondrial-like n=1 Tax=Corticium candelabrum TaxID=121492 RepID=UPI002E25F4A7|nr:protein SCO1 homolog, mitochondrial-like [Corticium candelabrum]